LCVGRRVLDVYANTGGWGLAALRAGATSATFVDKSAEACGMVARNAERNGFTGRSEVVCGEGKATLQQMLIEGRRFGAVVLDPPAFAKQKKAAGAALKGYREINALGMQLVEPGGFLFTSSCSHHIFEERYLEGIVEAASEVGRRLKLIRRGEQAPDHPVHPAMPESRYLKSLAFQVLADA
jgi:23S rRNA (cytosine1962-C5)-methyltransferase